MRRVLQCLLLLVACGRSATTRDPPVVPTAGLTADTARSADSRPIESGSPSVPLPPGGFADIATTPVHIWIGKAEDGVPVQLIVAGHADLACCDMISRAIYALLLLGAVKGDAYHGYVDIHVQDTPDGIFAMPELIGLIKQSRGSEAECARQVYLHEFQVAGHAEHTARLRTDAEHAFALATALGRPLLVWNDNLDAPPQFAPVLVWRAGGLAPLEFELDIAELRLPPPLQSVPGLLQDEVREARAEMGRLKNLNALFAELRALAASNTDLLLRQDRVRVREGGADATIADLNRYNDCLMRARTLWHRLERALPDLQIRDDTPSRAVARLDELIRDNTRTLGRLRQLGPRGSAEFPATRCEVSPINYDSKLRRELMRLDAKPLLARAQAEVERLRRLKAEYNTGLMASVVDSGLRGINLSHSDEALEKTFDQWMLKNQLRLWNMLRRQAVEHGVDLGPSPDPAGVLHASNMVMRVERSGERVRLTPHFVLTGPFYQVVAPQSGLVYYESALAEHNLDSSRD